MRTTSFRRRVAVIGGDGRHSDVTIPGVAMRCFESRKKGGRRGLDSIVTAIKSGSFDVVVVLARWIGHSEASAVRVVCRLERVPCRIVHGGWTMVERLLLGELRDGR